LPLCTARALTDNPTAKPTTTRSTATVAVWTARPDPTSPRSVQPSRREVSRHRMPPALEPALRNRSLPCAPRDPPAPSRANRTAAVPRG
jgi:hypothetical protein